MGQDNEPKSQRISRLIHDIYVTSDKEIFYDEALVLMARCADALLSEDEARLQYPQLWHYFDLYPEVKVEYDILMGLARMDAAGEQKTPENLPPRPDLKRRSQRDLLEVIRQTFSGFPQLSLDLATTRGAYRTIEPVEVTLGQGEATLSLNILPSIDEPRTWDLLCTVSSPEKQFEEKLEFAPLWLQQDENGPILKETALSKEGDGNFSALAPGNYVLHLRLGNHEYVVTELTLPEPG